MKLTLLALSGLFAGYVATVPSSDLSPHAASMLAAESVTMTLNVTPVGGTADTWTIVLGKQGEYVQSSYTFDTSIIATACDGKTVWNLDKKSNTYTEAPADAVSQADFVKNKLPWVFSAFYDKDWDSQVLSAKPGRDRKVSGVDVKEYQVTVKASPTPMTFTVMVDPKTKLVRGAVMPSKEPGGPETIIFAKSIALGGALPASTFAFNPPAGAKKYEKPAVKSVPYAEVQAIFNQSCVGCHGASGAKAGVKLDSYDSVMGSRVVTPGDGENSRIIRNMSGRGRVMPPAGKLPQDKIDTVKNWIAAGAKNE